MKKTAFLNIAKRLNGELHIVPLLYGSLGLEQRLHADLHADDIDILVPEVFLGEKWHDLASVMEEGGYVLYDLHEHAFERSGLCAAFASFESLTPFAGIDLSGIPVIEEAGVRYYLLDLRDYRNVYAASLQDGYRKNVKNKNDRQKLRLIDRALAEEAARRQDETKKGKDTGPLSLSSRRKRE